ncbi:MAG: polyphosphate polymerase domain-containing protein [Phaeodactylibacter sp.]|nr:polyphosphate polymerase domain-containing protein [Phaeodactylibacter sp.]MCB9048855.1 polyphosphate polymerase domain-containing protein [Lewinellaceae bacterium]
MVQNKEKAATEIAEAMTNGAAEPKAAKAPNKQETKASDFRKERKFVIEGFDIAQVEAVVKSHPALFTSPFPPRHINNIYFDTREFRNYRDNVAGSTNREKFRIRWYGEQYGQLKKPVLEIKIKRGLAGTKKYAPLKPIALKRGFSIDDIRTWLEESNLSPEYQEAIKYLIPTLHNRYRRKYFLSADKRFRVTLDDQLSYVNVPKLPGFFIRQESEPGKVVMELKYDTVDDADASWLTDHFPFRLSKNSKYAIGVKKLDTWNQHEW